MNEEDRKKPEGSGLSRRDFMKIGGMTLAVPMVASPKVLRVGGEDVEVYGPEKTMVTLHVNGKPLRAELEPRVTLLDALRETFDLTGSKRVCDRATCGACTVWLDEKPVYACSMLAIDAQGHKITTIEGISTPENMDPVQKAFWENDAQQCGFCTPGFVMATKAFVEKNPHATLEDARKGLSGNLCRCGTYVGIHSALRQLTGMKEA